MNSTHDVILRTENLTRIVNERHIVDDVSIEIRRGDVLAVVGPSGSGKTSFLRLLNRLDEPTSGSVFLEGRDYKEIAPRELRRRVGMVMQTPFLFRGSVADNIRFGPQQRDEDVSTHEIEELLKRVDLSGYGERGVSNLSGGEAQRVSLARTLANSPQVLLLDEPTSALDDAVKGDVEDLIRSIMQEQSLTVVIITHDMAQATRMANRIMILEDGKLTRIGALTESLDAHSDI